MRIKHDRQTHRLRGDHFLWETNRTILLYKDHGQLSLYFLWSLDRNYKKILDCSLYVFYNLKTTILWWVCLWGGGWGDQERQVDHPIFLVFILAIIIVILHYQYSFSRLFGHKSWLLCHIYSPSFWWEQPALQYLGVRTSCPSSTWKQERPHQLKI